MTREEYHAHKAQQERRRQIERRGYEAAKGPLDLPLLLLTLLLTGMGLLMLFSASFPSAYYESGDPAYYLKRQAFFAALGLVAMFVVSKINYQRWRGAGRLLVGLALFLLILVIIPHNPLAITANRATRWLGIKGVFQFQPSEIAKLAVIVYFSDTISKKREKMLTWRQGILPYVALLAVIGVLMMLEPHLSGTVLIFATGAVLMIVGGIQRWLVAVGVGGVSALGFLFIKLAEAGVIRYGAARIEMWHNPWEDYYGDGYQLAQSLITIGSGGLLGVGLGRGRQKFLYLPEQYNEVVLLVNEDNRITDYTLYTLGLLDAQALQDAVEAAARGEDVSIDTEVHSYSYDDILSLRFRLLTNTDCFVRQDGQWVDKSDDEAYLLNVLNSSDEIAVVGILRPAEGATTGSGQSGVIGYRADLMTHLLDKVTSAEIVREQQAAPTVDVFTGLPFEQEELKDAYTMEELQAYAAQLPAAAQQELMGYVSSMQAAGMDDGTIATQLMRAALSQSDGATYTGNLKRLGVSDPDDPEAINLFPKDFEAKDRIADRIAEYNKTLPEDAQLAYTDYIGLMISSITTIINAISYILIAFVAVSLVVSSIMIGIITYISVLERTREIGVLRSIGASRRDISRVFNAETLTIGFAAGTIGIGITLLLILPLNAIIRHLSGLSGVAALPAGAAVILVAISMLLTFLAGLIPSRIAAKKDPVIALRSE